MAQATTSYRSRLRAQYQETVRSELVDELKLSNLHEAPKLEKIVLNVGVGKHKEDNRYKEVVQTTLEKITGQKPVETAAKKSIAGFKIREGQKLGYKVTLRGDRMFDFFDRLVNIVLPRVRDFHGVPTDSFDEQGNYSLGLIEQSVFPELSFDDTVVLHGLQMNFITTGSDKESSRLLLKKLGMPFEKNKENN